MDCHEIDNFPKMCCTANFDIIYDELCKFIIEVFDELGATEFK